ncbi:MAG: serine protease [Povalibacter sp.]
MTSGTTPAELRALASRTLDRLAGSQSDVAVREAKELVVSLRNARQYEPMVKVAEAVSRIDPKDPANRRLYAQSLIETGNATAAIDVLQNLMRRLPKQHEESVEAAGLLGRAHKQIFFDSRDKSSAGARDSLKQAIAAYRKPYEADPANTWHGVNLVALLANSRRLGLPTPKGLDASQIARGVVQTLEAVPLEQQDEWHLPTLAEAYLGLDDWDAVERSVKAFVAKPDAKAFLVSSTLRQFTKIWDLESVERGRGVVDALRARLMQLPGGELQMHPTEVQDLQQRPAPDPAQLQAILGKDGAQTYRWWKTGLTRALSVASIRQRLGTRVGTGFLIRAGELGLEPANSLVVLTNHHVVNQGGIAPGLRPEESEVVFEAADPDTSYTVEKVLWESPPDQCDAAVLKLATELKTPIEPLEVAKELPTLGESARVYVIGYPGGRDLSFAFQDNELLDHEGPPNGRPQIPNVCRVHYAAPTESGNSGSPVFNGSLWQVIALHHKGGKIGMPRLNGTAGTYGANEGISIPSIASSAKQR